MTTTTGEMINQAPSPEAQRAAAGVDAQGRLLSADGRPLKKSLARAQRAQKLRAVGLIAPLLIFILITFIAPIADMLFRAVENQIVPDTLPRTTEVIEGWDATGENLPPEDLYQAMYFDLFLAAEVKAHTRLGSRLNYAYSGMSSLFRGTGRDLDDMGEVYLDAMEEIAPIVEEAPFWADTMAASQGRPADTGLLEGQRARLSAVSREPLAGDPGFAPAADIAEVLPRTAREYTAFALHATLIEKEDLAEEEPWEAVYAALALDLADPEAGARIAAYDGPGGATLTQLHSRRDEIPPADFKAALIENDEDWGDPAVWGTIGQLSGAFTSGYFLNAVDMQITPSGEIAELPESQQIYVFLFERTLFLSVTITLACLVLGYPIAWLLSNLPMRISNLLLILVLLPFWTSLLVRTSSWIVLLQSQGVVNDILVNLGVIGDDGRLQMMFNQTGTIVAMTHILLPFMILPLYSVMKTIPPSYVRAAKSLGATDWTAFWRVYFPNTVPGIGAGAILVFILSIGYYITPELVGGTEGIFISNRIAYHISSSLNWGLAAALASILLFVVLILYWCYDRIVGIDNVKLG